MAPLKALLRKGLKIPKNSKFVNFSIKKCIIILDFFFTRWGISIRFGQLMNLYIITIYIPYIITLFTYCNNGQ